MPVAPVKLLACPGGSVTRNALKLSGTSTTVGSLVAAITVRTIVGEAGAVCATAAAAREAAPRSTEAMAETVRACIIASSDTGHGMAAAVCGHAPGPAAHLRPSTRSGPCAPGV